MTKKEKLIKLIMQGYLERKNDNGEKFDYNKASATKIKK